MKVIKEIKSARTLIAEYRKNGLSIGLVPTMGALHEGHLSLIANSLKENDITVASIFVNPIQFNNQADFDNYPSSINRDLQNLEATGCDMVFTPEQSAMYPANPGIRFNFGQLENTMEGTYRPGHFSGVALVVLKLFHILTPTRAYFGQKDLQQYKIIEQLVGDTSLDIDLKMMPIIRNDDGLALSSRNQRLSPAGLKTASAIFKALDVARNAAAPGKSATDIIASAQNHLESFPQIKIEYLELVRLKDLTPVAVITEPNPLVLCFAGYIEGVRLIDNVVIA